MVLFDGKSGCSVKINCENSNSFDLKFSKGLFTRSEGNPSARATLDLLQVDRERSSDEVAIALPHLFFYYATCLQGR